MHQIATWNIHGAVGWDRRRDPRRIAAVLKEMDADLIGLQEVDTRHRISGRRCPLEAIADEAGYHAVCGPTLYGRHGHYGNALLSRRAPRNVRYLDLSVRGREPRCALDVDLALGDGTECRVVVTHLGLRSKERHEQVQRLVSALDDGRELPLVVLGDINEWRRTSRALGLLNTHLGAAPKVRTFPSFRPLVALDRIWVRPHAGLRDVRVHGSALARQASDHLPVLGRFHPRAWHDDRDFGPEVLPTSTVTEWARRAPMPAEELSVAAAPRIPKKRAFGDDT